MSAKKSHLSYWTPQTHRRTNHHQRSKRHHRKPELVQSMMFSHKKHQYYSPQLQRRKSEDFSYFNYQNYQINEKDTSDSSDDENESRLGLGLGGSQKFEKSAVLPPNSQQFSNPSSQHQPARRLQYYGGVHPVYLPNSRQKAQKLQKTPLYEPQHSVLQVQQQQHCQGCCHHSRFLAKNTSDDKKCIIS